MDTGNSCSIHACSFFSSLHCIRWSQSTNRHSDFVNGFRVSDGVALFTSSTSILMFLSILTSRYSEQDFLQSLPSRLMFGLTTLFVSITTMMITFTITSFIACRHGWAWIPILIALFAAVPASVFASLQYPLLADVINSTFGSRLLFKPREHRLYQ